MMCSKKLRGRIAPGTMVGVRDFRRWVVARRVPKSQIQNIYAEHSAAHAGNG